MENCPICEKHKAIDVPLYEDEHWVITAGPLASQLLGYLYIEPKRHVENWSEFRNEELMTMGSLIKKCEKSLKELMDVDRIYTVTISEAVRHLHIHIVPRVVDKDTRGLELIKQATTSEVTFENTISLSSYKEFYEQLGEILYS
ncbi:HIT family protein [Rossellomorea vietnamensis]|uniref:HIT family protein n=1 Tax=Rossellomorea vietnamensis TaxID=218284 RepID=UPI0005556051|nr:HIT family protein [Rossellomorea vietnamensis]